ncbi:MAG TPA: YusG family protein [Pseudoneobacillus sp.]|nr:YusG family protein [Pseudoneobacillus sp.]
MTLKQQKMDITDRIVGKLKNGTIEFYLDNEQIGKVSLPEGSQFNMSHHFEVDDQQRVYQNYTSTDQPDARYTDCDEGGWC